MRPCAGSAALSMAAAAALRRWRIKASAAARGCAGWRADLSIISSSKHEAESRRQVLAAEAARVRMASWCLSYVALKLFNRPGIACRRKAALRIYRQSYAYRAARPANSSSIGAGANKRSGQCRGGGIASRNWRRAKCACGGNT